MPEFAQEFLHNVENDAQELLEAHWREIAINQDKIQLNPDWGAYDELEGAGKLRIFTAREAGKLVGYFVVIVGANLHYRDHVFAVNDILFLAKEHRRGHTGKRLIKFAESCLKADGVSVLTINTKTHKPFDVLMTYLGFSCVERVYSKFIGD